MYYLSIDGGGSKTAFLITDAIGNILVEDITGGCSYPQIGIKGVIRVISGKLEQLLESRGLKIEQFKGVAIGLPCYGENPEADKELEAAVREMWPFSSLCICNDVELGWAGSLGLESGVHVVAGTGAIAYGKDNHNNSARANGWHEDFSDEGSGYWLGMQTLSLFAKQMDGRLKRSRIYALMEDELDNIDSKRLVPLYMKNYKGNRKKVAALQQVLYQAALEGDINAVELYRKAAEELAYTVQAVASRLDFANVCSIPVSYSGGVFKVGTYILEPMKKMLKDMGFKMKEPILDPVRGGILIAAASVSPRDVNAIKTVLTGIGDI